MQIPEFNADPESERKQKQNSARKQRIAPQRNRNFGERSAFQIEHSSRSAFFLRRDGFCGCSGGVNDARSAAAAENRGGGCDFDRMCGNRVLILSRSRIESAEFQTDFLRSLARRNENVLDACGSGNGMLFNFRRIDAEAGEFERGSFERFQRAVSPQIHGKGQRFSDFPFCGGKRCLDVPLADESEELRVTGTRRQCFDFKRRQCGAERVADCSRASEERVVEEIVER